MAKLKGGLQLLPKLFRGYHAKNISYLFDTVITGQRPDFSARRRRPNLHSNHRKSVSNNSGLLTFCALEAMSTTIEENEFALSLFCDFGIFSQDKFCL